MSLVQSLHNRFQRWYIHNLLLAIIVAWLWSKTGRVFARIEHAWRNSVGPAHVYLEDLPDLLAPGAELGVQQVGDQHGLMVQRHFFDARMTIEHVARWRTDGSLSETVTVTRTHSRGLHITLVDGELVQLKRLDLNAQLPIELSQWECDGLNLFMERLRARSPLPRRRVGLGLSFDTSISLGS